jgi:hypothetical protein
VPSDHDVVGVFFGVGFRFPDIRGSTRGKISLRHLTSQQQCGGKLVGDGSVISRGSAAHFSSVVVERSLRFGFSGVLRGFSGGFVRGLLLNARHEGLNLTFFVRLRTVQFVFHCRFSAGQKVIVVSNNDAPQKSTKLVGFDHFFGDDATTPLGRGGGSSLHRLQCVFNSYALRGIRKSGRGRGRSILTMTLIETVIARSGQASLKPRNRYSDCRSLGVGFSVMTIFLGYVLPVTVVVAVQSIQYRGICSYPAHLFIDVLAKVGYVKNATSIIQVRINQIFPKAFEQRQRDLSLVYIHDIHLRIAF